MNLQTTQRLNLHKRMSDIHKLVRGGDANTPTQTIPVTATEQQGV